MDISLVYLFDIFFNIVLIYFIYWIISGSDASYRVVCCGLLFVLLGLLLWALAFQRQWIHHLPTVLSLPFWSCGPRAQSQNCHCCFLPSSLPRLGSSQHTLAYSGASHDTHLPLCGCPCILLFLLLCCTPSSCIRFPLLQVLLPLFQQAKSRELAQPQLQPLLEPLQLSQQLELRQQRESQPWVQAQEC